MFLYAAPPMSPTAVTAIDPEASFGIDGALGGGMQARLAPQRQDEREQSRR
jgi:hypothetical protein